MNELHFLHPEWFWLLLAIPAIWGVRLLRRPYGGDWERIVDRHLMPFVLSGREAKPGLMPLIALSLALLLAVLAMAGPSWERREVPVFRNQQAVVIALDFSTSMYAEDEKPNRLTLARFKLLDILNMRRDAQNALIVFAGDAFTVTPLTDDIQTIQEQVKNLSPEIMPVQGSLLAPAINRAAGLLQQAGLGTGNILLVTDGVADTEEAQAAAEQVRSKGYTVSILSVGKEEGIPIPLAGGGFVEDRQGNTVLVGVNKDDLRAVVEAGNGRFAQAVLGDEDIDILRREWKPDSKRLLNEGQGREVDTWVNEGYWLVLVLLPLAAFAFRRGWLGAVLVCFVVLPQPEQAYAFGWRDLWQTPDQQGQEAMDHGQVETAAELFRDPAWKGSAAYQNKDYTQAEKYYRQNEDAVGRYNYGNALARQGKYEQAIKAYENALQLQPDFPDAEENLRVLQQALEQQQQNQQEQQQQANQRAQQQQQQSGQQGQEQQSGSDQGSSDNQSAPDTGGQGSEQQADREQQPNEAGQYGRPEPDPDEEGRMESQVEDPRQREQDQATEQWLRRIPDDPAGLWRRKFLHQYQQRGRQPEGEAW